MKVVVQESCMIYIVFSVYKSCFSFPSLLLYPLSVSHLSLLSPLTIYSLKIVLLQSPSGIIPHLPCLFFSLRSFPRTWSLFPFPSNSISSLFQTFLFPLMLLKWVYCTQKRSIIFLPHILHFSILFSLTVHWIPSIVDTVASPSLHLQIP